MAINKYSVIEAQNIQLGQAGSALADASQPGTGGDQLTNSDTFPQGVTIFGRWDSLTLQTAGDKAIVYFG